MARVAELDMLVIIQNFRAIKEACKYIKDKKGI